MPVAGFSQSEGDSKKVIVTVNLLIEDVIL
jgi:hypothetical protein